MEVTFYIDTEQKVIIEHFKGEVTLAKIIKLFPVIWEHPDYSAKYDGIVDFRACTLLFSPQELNDLVQAVANSEKGMRGKAAIMVSEPVAAAMGALYSERMKSIQMASIFCSNSEAIRFLKMDPEIFEKISDPQAIHIHVD